MAYSNGCEAGLRAEKNKAELGGEHNDLTGHNTKTTHTENKSNLSKILLNKTFSFHISLGRPVVNLWCAPAVM